jgi:hypothetical protein
LPLVLVGLFKFVGRIDVATFGDRHANHIAICNFDASESANGSRSDIGDLGE